MIWNCLAKAAPSEVSTLSRDLRALPQGIQGEFKMVLSIVRLAMWLTVHFLKAARAARLAGAN